MYLSGFHAVHEALLSRPQDVARVFVSERAPRARRQTVEALCKKRKVAIEEVTDRRLFELVDEPRQGFVAEVRSRAGAAPASGDADLVVLLEDVVDPRNLGALLRVCEGAGVGRVLIRDRGSAPLTETVAHTSAGASEWLEVERITNSSQSLEQLQKEGFWAYGAAEGGAPPWSLDLSGKVVICLGGEEKGLRDRTRKTCDALVGLPMRGRVSSLNVATAAAALLYEAVRQRLTKEPADSD